LTAKGHIDKTVDRGRMKFDKGKVQLLTTAIILNIFLEQGDP